MFYFKKGNKKKTKRYKKKLKNKIVIYYLKIK